MSTLQSRIIILGDAHTDEREREHWAEAWQDLNELEADAVFMLGDLSGQWTGEERGLLLALDIFKDCQAPWQSIIGNHDLEGADFDNDTDNLQNVLMHFGRETPYFSVEVGAFTVIGLSNTKHRDNVKNNNELVTGNEQLAWFEAEVKKNSDRSIIVLSHAPILGSDLVNLPELHVRVGNCYMNQNQDPGDLMKIVYENPNILFWFSGHCHLSHVYDRSITARLGCHFIHCGVISRLSARDGNIHTRILDVYDDHFEIRTFDHSTRECDDALAYRESRSVSDYRAYRDSILGKRFVPRDVLNSDQKPLLPAQTTRLMWISDMHVSGPLYPSEMRIVDWCRYEAIQHEIDGLVLGGDIVQNGKQSELEHFLKALNLHIPIYILTGSKDEGKITADGFSRTRVIDEHSYAVDGLPDNVALLMHAHQSERIESLDFIKHIKAEHVIVFGHYPASSIVEVLPEWLTKRKVSWICGHTHLAETRTHGQFTEYISGALDPTKAREQLPEIFLINIDVDGGLSVERRHIPRKRLLPERLANGIYGVSTQAPIGNASATWLQIPSDQLCKASEFSGDISLRLGQMLVTEVLHVVNTLPTSVKHMCIQFQPITEDSIFDNGVLNEYAVAYLQPYQELCAACAKKGVALDFEQSQNYVGDSEGSIVLGGMPWHISPLLDQLRATCAEGGLSDMQVGFCFNTAHGFSTKTSNQKPTFRDWIYALKDYIHSVIIAQTEKNNQDVMAPVTTTESPLINIVGLKAILGDSKSGLLHFVYAKTQAEAEAALQYYRDA